MKWTKIIRSQAASLKMIWRKHSSIRSGELCSDKERQHKKKKKKKRSTEERSAVDKDKIEEHDQVEYKSNRCWFRTTRFGISGRVVSGGVLTLSKGWRSSPDFDRERVPRQARAFLQSRSRLIKRNRFPPRRSTVFTEETDQHQTQDYNPWV